MDDDSDSGVDCNDDDSTSSVGEPQQNGRWDHGRQYAVFYEDPGRDAKFIEPVDELQREQWARRHEVFKELIPLHRSALPPQGRCLDVGAGLGLWAVEFADKQTDWRVVAIDVFPNFPRWVPPNMMPMLEDVESLSYTATYDFIMVRDMQWSVNLRDVMPRLVRSLLPRGSLEVVCLGPVEPSNGAEGGGMIENMPQQIGMPSWADIETGLPTWMKEAGLVDVRAEVLLVLVSSGSGMDTTHLRRDGWSEDERYCKLVLVHGTKRTDQS
ncbi:hypothetical protein M409DRAFT_31076 [Zasmidium cellare ATCC 36951]|uniref:Uncharacterized protein n=1 Tax=Zasmidium cellare ATCC 36951 TaxID=1080233 RepID=A0A6A6BXY2_ZASCE|nr:uncharacterized protein M409DRAFT_31076 [Zasmidium cellare ATCC 36951]KAF2158412.1 hypothetical protein M409DRAFT_31076 [Zasmidium cellare ATCC 36951]